MAEEVTIFADGASKGNPGPGGWGAVVATPERVVELGGREARTTNNRMELTAALMALRAAKGAPAPVAVHTDSSYVINGITKWVHGWQRNGWLTKEKKEVLNKDLWAALVAAAEDLPHGIAWEYVGGHVGIAGNERVDSIASDFAEGKRVTLYDGPRAGYAINLHDLSHDAARKEAKASSRSHSSAKAYSYVSLVDGTIEVHPTWAQCEARVRGKRARFKKALSREDEARIIAEFSS